MLLPFNDDDLMIYIHIPFCASKCRYCDFASHVGDGAEIADYVAALCREIRASKELYGNRHVTSIYMGGGTPSLLSAHQFGEIVKALEEAFGLVRMYGDKGPFSITYKKTGSKMGYLFNSPVKDLEKQIEFSVECNPESADYEKFKAYRQAGVNRISIGLQSAADRDLRVLGRAHDNGRFAESYFRAKDAGFENINIDLIQSIPGQDLLEFMKSLYSVMMLGPDHISVYSLAIEEGTPLARGTFERDGRKYFKNDNGEELAYPTDEEDREIYHTAVDFLEKAGLSRYEISNFAKKDRECRHNKGYWMGENYIGYGLNASSLIDGVRWKNTKDMGEYMEICGKAHNSAEGKAPGFPGESLGTQFGRAQNAAEEMAPGIPKVDFGKLRVEAEKLSVADKMAEFVFLGLRMQRGIAKEEFIAKFGVDFDFKFGETTQKFIDEGLLGMKEFEFYDPVTKSDYVKTRVFLTDRGIDVSNRVMAEYLPD